jgi:L-cystine transport system substrate-binding protein
MKKDLTVFLLLFFGLSFVFAEGKKETAGQRTVIYAATQPDYPPFCYLNENNQLTGFDVDVFKAVDERLENYTIDLQPLGWEAMFLSLESHRLDMIGDEIAINPEREEKFLFSEPYFEAQSVIIVKKGRNDIKTLKDLEGKNVVTYVGDSYDMLVSSYNKENGNRINIFRVEGIPEADTLLDIQNGKYDAHVNDPVMTTAVIAQHNLDVEIVGDIIQGDLIGFAFNKDEQGRALKAAIDPVIRELKANGTLSRLSIKWTGKDFIPK